jgi:hypothetical protein
MTPSSGFGGSGASSSAPTSGTTGSLYNSGYQPKASATTPSLGTYPYGPSTSGSGSSGLPTSATTPDPIPPTTTRFTTPSSSFQTPTSSGDSGFGSGPVYPPIPSPTSRVVGNPPG